MPDLLMLLQAQSDVVVAAKNTNALLGAGIGIGQIGGRAVEAIARQPQASGDIRGAMILTAALVEGAGLAALVFALLFKLLK